MMQSNKMRYKVIAWLLTLSLVITLIPDIGHAAEKNDNAENTALNTVEVTEEGTIIEKTESTTTFDLGDGQLKTIFHGGQVRYKDDGKWIEYDPSLQKIKSGEKTEQEMSLEGYRYTNTAGDKKHYIPENVSEDTPVRMEYKDYSIEFSLMDRELSQLAAADADVTLEKKTVPAKYAGTEEVAVDAVYGDEKKSTLTYTSTEDGVKETLTLFRRPENNVFRYHLKLTGMTARKNVTDGGVTYYDKETGEITGYIAPPWMNDATGEAYSEDITYTLNEVKDAEGEYILTMTVSNDYLDDPARQYPVTIDPSSSWSGTSRFQDAYVISGSTYGNTNFYESGTKKMPAGKNSTGTHRTFMKFVGLGGTVSGYSVQSAILTIYETGTGASAQKVGAHRIAGSWSPSTIKWNTMPACGWGFAYATTKKTANTKHSMDVTDYVRQVSAGSIPDYGLVLINGSTSYACFYGTRSSSYKPSLSVTYHAKPTAPGTVSVSRADNGSFTDTDTFNECEPVYASWAGATAYQVAEVQYKIEASDSDTPKPVAVGQNKTDLTAYRNIGHVSAAGTNIPVPDSGYLPKGKYKLSIRLKDAAGNFGPEKSVDFTVNGEKPEVGNVQLKDADGNDINGKFTTVMAPIIEFSGINDTNLASQFITYAIVSEGTEPAAADYKTAGITSTQNEDGSYNGSITGAFAGISADGIYDIHVQVTDTAGNINKKIIKYKRDTAVPTASLKLTDIETGDVLDIEQGNGIDPLPYPQYIEVTGTVNIEAKVDGTGSEAKARLRLYRDNTYDEVGSPGDLIETNERGEVVLSKNFSIDKNLVLDTASVCGSGGIYFLELTVEDESGQTATVTKHLEISNRLKAPKIKIDPTNDRTTMIDWNIQSYPQQKMKVGALVYRLNEDDEWHTLVEPEDDSEYLPFKGKAEITLPETDSGSWTLQIAGRDNAGYIGDSAAVTLELDTIAPTVDMEDTALKHYLECTVKDEQSGVDKWQIYAKESTSNEYPESPVKEGFSKIDDDTLIYIDLSNEFFIPETMYDFKIVAFDKAGNCSEAACSFEIPSEEKICRLVAPALKIKKGKYQDPDETNFRVRPSQEQLTLDAETSSGTDNVTWYIDNQKTDSSRISSYTPNVWHEVIVERINEDGVREYNVPVRKNGTHDAPVPPTDTSGSGRTFSHRKIVSFHFETPNPERVYQFKVDDNAFVTVQPNTTYYVSDITDSQVYADTMWVRELTSATSPSGWDRINVYYDIIDDGEFFNRMDAENYVPTNLSADAKINSKTYLTWDTPDNIPSNLYYEVYRSTEEGFIPEEPVATVHAGYYTEMNVDHGQEYYYRVCAVFKNADGSISQRSSYSFEESTKVADENEYSKHLGMKDFWEYTEFTTPNGNGYIEKSHGNFLYQQKDAQIPNEGFDVHLTRTYNSQSSTQGAFGFGWTHEYDIELLNICENNQTNEFTTVALKDGNGALYYFTRESSEQEFVSPLGKYVNLTAETAEQTKTVKVVGAGSESTKNLSYKFILDTKDSVSYYFNSGGQLILMEDANGNFVLFEHDPKTGLLTKMLTNNNKAISFVYNTDEDGKDPATVKEIKLPDGSSVQYEYDKPLLSSEQLLKTVTKKSGDSEISYTYDYHKPLLSVFSRNLNKITDATGQCIYTIDYDHESDQVRKATYPNGEYITFDYSGWGTETVTTKYSDGDPVMIEKDFFDEITGRCEKSIRGVDNISDLESGMLLDETVYTYKDELLVSTTHTAEYLTIDEDGFIVQHEGTKVNKVEYEDDAPVKETEDDGSISEYTYNTAAAGEHLEGLVASEKTTSPDGKVTEHKDYKYDANGNITETIDHVAKTKVIQIYVSEGPFKGELSSRSESLLSENGSGYVLQSTATYVYTYGNDGSKTETCTQTRPDSSDVKTTTVYDSMGRVISETDSRGYTTTYTYDGFGRCTGTVYKYGKSATNETSTQRVYDANGMVIKETLEDDILKKYEYDNMQRVIKTTISKEGEPVEILTTAYEYEPTLTVYKGEGADPVTVKNAYVTTTKDSDNNIVSQTYQDHKGNIVRSFEKGLYTDMTYNLQGDMVTKWSMGKTVSATEGLLHIYVYDDKGNLTATVTGAEYITEGNKTGYMVRPGSIVTKSEYDKSGNVIKSIDPLGNQVIYSYDDNGRLVSATDPHSASETSPVTYKYSYDVTSGNNTKDIVKGVYQNADGSISQTVSEITTDTADRVIKVEDLGTNSTDDTSIFTTYEYDIRGNLLKAVDKKGNYRQYSYDERDRLTSIEYFDSGVNTLKTSFTYDDSDNMTSMSDFEVLDGTLTMFRYTAYRYDGFNRLTGVAEINCDSVPNEQEIEAHLTGYEYDAQDRLEKITYPDNISNVDELVFEYQDITGWLENVSAKSGQNTYDVREYCYDDFGRVISIKDYTDFLNGKQKWIEREFTYDQYSRTTSIEYTTNGSDDIKEGHYYVYDLNSNITSERTVNSFGQANDTPYEEIREHTYDAAGRLTGTDITEKDSTGTVTKQESLTYAFDAAGNMTGKSIRNGEGSITETTVCTFNEFNQLTGSVTTDASSTATSNKVFTYDPNGNQISDTDSITGIASAFTYDADNRLKTATETNGEIIEYIQENKYNGFGQRVQKKEGTDVTGYFYDGTSILYTTDENSDTTSFNLVGAEDNIILTARPSEGGADFYSYTKDIRESTVNLVGKDGTAPVSYTYSDHGETDIHGDQDFYNEICYTAGVYDDTTGLYYLNARFYDPEDAVFMSQDTYRGDRSRTGTLNLYSYCAGNPISYTDPSGHAFWGVVGAALGAYDGYKYAKKKKLKGWKKAAAITGGALLGAVNPFKVVKAAKSGYKAYKAVKYTKKAQSSLKQAKAVKKALQIPEPPKTTKVTVIGKNKPVNVKKGRTAVVKKNKTAGGWCFVAGTKISTEKGFMPIEKITVGSYVWSENPETNSKALKKVNKIFVREKDSIVRLSINGEIIETTDEHPFYVEGKGFVGAKHLTESDEVRLQSGETAGVDKVETIRLSEPVKVYNFEVEDNHTYYVSEQRVLVHNMCMADAPKTVDLYRAVGVDEYESIIKTNSFSTVDGKTLSAKEFGNTFSETLEFANHKINKDKVAIIRVTIPANVNSRLNHMRLDTPIFKQGTTVVEREMLEIFNKNIIEIKHIY